MTRQLSTTALATLMAGALFLFVAAPSGFADARANCQHAIERAEAKLDKAIRDRGDRSREADARRRDLNAQREKCWNENHQWWNGREHRWEAEHNWENQH